MNYKKAYAKIKENKIMKIFDSLNVDENVKTELLKKTIAILINFNYQKIN